MSTRPTWRGHFDTHHIARLNFILHSPASQAQAALEGIIDTGFTGFVQVPLDVATVLNLLAPPYSWGSTLLANGATQRVLLKRAHVSVEDETQDGICQIPMAPDSPILIGMDFLRRFDRMLIVSSTFGVQLVPEQPVPGNSGAH